MGGFLKNPASLWLKWLVRKYWYQFTYRRQHLKIQYLARFSDCTFGRYNTLYEGAILTQVSLGDYSYIAANTRLARVAIGKFSCIGPDVMAGLGRHPATEFASIHPVFYSPNAQAGVTFADRPYFDEFDSIIIGNDVWVGARATIRDGVTIGDGAIVAAGAVVVADVPPYAIVGGVPAKLIKYRFSTEQIEALQTLKWWDKDEGWLRANFTKLHHVDELLRFAREN